MIKSSLQSVLFDFLMVMVIQDKLNMQMFILLVYIFNNSEFFFFNQKIQSFFFFFHLFLFFIFFYFILYREELFEYLPIILRNELSSATVVLEEKYKEFEEKKLKVTENDRGTCKFLFFFFQLFWILFDFTFSDYSSKKRISFRM